MIVHQVILVYQIMFFFNSYWNRRVLKLKYKYKTESDSEYKDLVDKSTIVGGNWSSRSLLDINCGPDIEQLLVKSTNLLYYR